MLLQEYRALYNVNKASELDVYCRLEGVGPLDARDIKKKEKARRNLEKARRNLEKARRNLEGYTELREGYTGLGEC